IKIAEGNKRIIVTRDKGLCIRARKKNLDCFLVYPDQDLVDILAKLSLKYKIDLNADPNFSRCTECNGILEKIEENKWKCTKCGKEYWKGSHWRTIEDTLIKARSKTKANESRAVSRN
ncbi:MAG: hypothetical protein JZD40_03620, partial [Sulfolobus sp.]|nr:hypothetical protein [Sulfolobus sp.]